MEVLKKIMNKDLKIEQEQVIGLKWTKEVVNITPNNSLTINNLIDKVEAYIYFDGSWSERQVMYFNEFLTEKKVMFQSSVASGNKNFGAVVDFDLGKITNDILSSSNITKIMYR